MILLALCCVIVVINVFLQYSRSRATGLAMERQRSIFVQDSLKAVQNALMMTQRYQFDSLSHQATITSLLQQKETDSLRYEVTMQKIGQQLGQQRIALNNINRILNPLFPLKVQYDFKMRVSKFPDSSRVILVTQGKKIFDSVPNEYQDPVNSIFKIDYREVIKGKNDLFTSDNHMTTLFTPVNVLIKESIPVVGVKFYRQDAALEKKLKRIKTLAQVMKQPFHGPVLEFTGLVNPYITYEYSWEAGSHWDELTISMRGLVDDSNLDKNLLTSINDLQGADILIDYRGGGSGKLPLVLSKMTILAGANFQKKYELEFDEEDNQWGVLSKDDIHFNQKDDPVYLPNHR